MNYANALMRPTNPALTLKSFRSIWTIAVLAVALSADTRRQNGRPLFERSMRPRRPKVVRKNLSISVICPIRVQFRHGVRCEESVPWSGGVKKRDSPP